MGRSEREGEALWFSSVVKNGLTVFITDPGIWLQSFVMGCLTVVFFPVSWWILPLFMSLKGISRLRDAVGLTRRLGLVFLSELPLIIITVSGFVLVYCSLWNEELSVTSGGGEIKGELTFLIRLNNLAGLSLFYAVAVFNTLVCYISIKIPSLPAAVAVRVSLKQLLLNCVQCMLSLMLLAGIFIVFDANISSVIAWTGRFIRAHVTDSVDAEKLLNPSWVYAAAVIYYMGTAVYVLRKLSRFMFVNLIENIKKGRISLRGFAGNGE